MDKADASSCYFENVSNLAADRSVLFQEEDDFFKSSILDVKSFKNEEGPTPTSSYKNLSDISVMSNAAISQISPIYPITRVIKEEDLLTKQKQGLQKQSVSSYFPSALQIPQN